MLLIALSIFGVLSVFSSIFVVAALMLSSKHSAAEPWEEYYAVQPQKKPVLVPVKRIEASN